MSGARTATLADAAAWLSGAREGALSEIHRRKLDALSGAPVRRNRMAVT
jgi:hypothetical protein